MPAPILSLGAAACFAAANVALHRGARTAPTGSAVLLSVFSGAPFFFVVALVFGALQTVPPQAFALFVFAGLVHFVAGRTFIYASISIIGASRSAVFACLAPVFSLLLAIALLEESVALLAAIGALFTIAGPLLVTRGPMPSDDLDAGPLRRGIALAVLGAFCFGVSPIVIAAGLDHVEAPLMGTFVSYLGAAVVLAVHPRMLRGAPIRSLDRNALTWFGAAALSTNLAQLLLFLALDEGQVAVVVVLLQLTAIFTTAATYAINRTLERITLPVVAGGVLAVVGSAMVVAAG